MSGSRNYQNSVELALSIWTRSSLACAKSAETAPVHQAYHRRAYPTRHAARVAKLDLATMQLGKAKQTIEPGMCRMGCGKKARDASMGIGSEVLGRVSWARELMGSDTCCHRCGLGTGLHDRTCGLSIAAIASVEAGRCKNLCGRTVAPGLTKSGKKFDTCCRDCARGVGHSKDCIPN